MIIEGPDFKLTPVKDSDRFDLEMLKVVNKGKANERTEFDIVGYGYSLERALKIIINRRIENKYDVMDLQLFLSKYKEEMNKLVEFCKV